MSWPVIRLWFHSSALLHCHSQTKSGSHGHLCQTRPRRKNPSGFLPAELNGRKKHQTVSYLLILSGAYWGISILMSSDVFKNRLLSADKFSQRTQQVRLCRKLRKLKLLRPRKHQIMPATLHLPIRPQRETLETTQSSLNMASPVEPVIFNFHIFSPSHVLRPNKTFHRIGNGRRFFFSTSVVFKALGHHQLLAAGVQIF